MENDWLKITGIIFSLLFFLVAVLLVVEVGGEKNPTYDLGDGTTCKYRFVIMEDAIIGTIELSGCSDGKRYIKTFGGYREIRR